ncbi:MAG: hypothetical protein A2156_05730 [Deltaproteobacteria bacterium RBG_16_48_10]|nr:MAG: hypothetical protein A2156_05730 [Deltaproteobacteria bacterium RBG_16_48_10]
MDSKIEIEDSVKTAARDKIIELYSSQNITPSVKFEDFRCPSKLFCLGTKDKDKWRSGTWAYIGSQYGEAQINGKFTKVLIVAMDKGGYGGTEELIFEKTQNHFRTLAEAPGNGHMRGVSLILKYLLDEKDKYKYSIQYSLTNAVKCSTERDNMDAVRQNRVISNCSIHLKREINILNPDIIITQGKHPGLTIRHFFPANGEIREFEKVSLWETERQFVLATPHPTRLKGMRYRSGEMPKYYYEAIDALKELFR